MFQFHQGRHMIFSARPFGQYVRVQPDGTGTERNCNSPGLRRAFSLPAIKLSESIGEVSDRLPAGMEHYRDDIEMHILRNAVTQYVSRSGFHKKMPLAAIYRNLRLHQHRGSSGLDLHDMEPVGRDHYKIHLQMTMPPVPLHKEHPPVEEITQGRLFPCRPCDLRFRHTFPLLHRSSFRDRSAQTTGPDSLLQTYQFLLDYSKTTIYLCPDCGWI